MKTPIAQLYWYTFFSFISLILVSKAYAEISRFPPLLTSQVTPNIFFTLDDSGSMRWEAMPDSVTYAELGFPAPIGVYELNSSNRSVIGFADGEGTHNEQNSYVARYRCACVNSLYYNPEIRYEPWIMANGEFMSEADPKHAKFNPQIPYHAEQTATIDLTSLIQSEKWSVPLWRRDDFLGDISEKRNFYPAVYYLYRQTPSCSTELITCFVRIEIKDNISSYEKYVKRTDCIAETYCTYKEEMQNFANWFQYSRSRILLARGAIGKAFSRQSDNLRLGYGAINAIPVLAHGVSTDFSLKNRVEFFDYLYRHPIGKYETPLRQALDEVGQYFMRTDHFGPWQNIVGEETSFQSTCRKNYHILMTDGYWNGAPAAFPRNQNVDGTPGKKMVSASGEHYQYQAIAPYSDKFSDTLADVAMYYWKTDLRADWKSPKQKNVPVVNTSVNPAFWQHLVQMTIGLGVHGSLDPETDLAALKAGLKTWPEPENDSIFTIDDLWHAAINGHGRFFNANNSIQLSDGLTVALNEMSAQTLSASGLGYSNIQIQENGKILVASFKTEDWSGTLEQKSINLLTNQMTSDWIVGQTSKWPTVRRLFTYKEQSRKGVAFQFENLDVSEQNNFAASAISLFNGDVKGADILAYIQGDQTHEIKNGGVFRNRENLLGDIVGSVPQYIKQNADEGYSYLPSKIAPEAQSYFEFFQSLNEKQAARIYVGSNDGMLHAFSSRDGHEEFAYIPKAVLSKLPALANSAYTHQFFVNATPNIKHAYIDGWKTILVGSTGAGGRSVFALNVSNENFTAKDVLWEFTANDDKDLGYTIGTPQIGIMPDGNWVAIFGNGYASDSKEAILFVLNLANGKLIKKIHTGKSSVTRVNNGLATPRLVIDSNSMIQAIYAGDLFGNLWKFDVLKTGIELAFSGKPLFQAKNRQSEIQPITTQPELFPHAEGGLMVIFGTGKLFESTDASNLDLQSIYGIWDQSWILQKKFSAPLAMSDLVQQTLDSVDVDFMLLTNNLIDWKQKSGWYIHLDQSKGERVIVEPSLIYNSLVVTTVIPGIYDDPCIRQEKSNSMLIDAQTGGSVAGNSFDTNHDGVFDAFDIRASAQAIPLSLSNTILRNNGGRIRSYKMDQNGNLVESNYQLPVIPTLRLWSQILGKE